MILITTPESSNNHIFIASVCRLKIPLRNTSATIIVNSSRFLRAASSDYDNPIVYNIKKLRTDLPHVLSAEVLGV